MLGEEESELRIEYSFSITTTDNNNKYLLDMLFNLQILLKNKRNFHNNNFTCSLIVVSKDFFDVDLM